MTQEVLEKAAKVLLSSRGLTGGDDPKYLPKIYIVDGHCYWFLNVARRAAYGTNHVIHVMTIEEAWEIYTHLNRSTLKQEVVAWDLDQTGFTFDGRLFNDNKSIYADMSTNPIVPLTRVP